MLLWRKEKRRPRMGYTIGIVWCYYTKAWYSIGIVEFLKMSYTLYWNYTKYLDCVKLKYMGSIDFMWSQSGYRVNNFLKRIHIVWINLIELSIKHKRAFILLWYSLSIKWLPVAVWHLKLVDLTWYSIGIEYSIVLHIFVQYSIEYSIVDQNLV